MQVQARPKGSVWSLSRVGGGLHGTSHTGGQRSVMWPLQVSYSLPTCEGAGVHCLAQGHRADTGQVLEGGVCLCLCACVRVCACACMCVCVCV